jgi:hypothetical protein
VNPDETVLLRPTVSADQTVQLRHPLTAMPVGPGQSPQQFPMPSPPQFPPQGPPSPAQQGPVAPGSETEPARAWWAFLPTLVWLAAAAFAVGALIALS